MPAMGFGTWQDKDSQEQAVETALKSGYRHIDTALAYGNESEVGDGIKDSGVPREQIWLTTKLDNDWHKHVSEGIDSSLKSLKTDYVDLYLMVSGDFEVHSLLTFSALASFTGSRGYVESIQRLELCRYLEGNAEARRNR